MIKMFKWFKTVFRGNVKKHTEEIGTHDNDSTLFDPEPCSSRWMNSAGGNEGSPSSIKSSSDYSSSLPILSSLSGSRTNHQTTTYKPRGKRHAFEIASSYGDSSSSIRPLLSDSFGIVDETRQGSSFHFIAPDLNTYSPLDNIFNLSCQYLGTSEYFGQTVSSLREGGNMLVDLSEHKLYVRVFNPNSLPPIWGSIIHHFNVDPNENLLHLQAMLMREEGITAWEAVRLEYVFYPGCVLPVDCNRSSRSQGLPPDAVLYLYHRLSMTNENLPHSYVSDILARSDTRTRSSSSQSRSTSTMPEVSL